ncbi:hypothetical protein C8R45DRAFT_1038929 [Mycena sanguinolenta]|nr:hypothetical protein C8R45DRAFT_1038929 [Mycena sanguinolenta]
MAAAAYHQHQQEAAAHFYHHQQQQQAQELEERHTEEERYHLQQLHQQQYHAHHHIEAQGDSQEPAYPDSISAGVATRKRYIIRICSPPAPLEARALVAAAAAAASPVSPYSLEYPPTPQLAYSYGRDDEFRYAGASGGCAGKYDLSGLDAGLGLLDMNMNMSMGIGLGVG